MANRGLNLRTSRFNEAFQQRMLRTGMRRWRSNPVGPTMKKRQLFGVFYGRMPDKGLNLRTSRFNEAFQQRMLRTGMRRWRIGQCPHPCDGKRAERNTRQPVRWRCFY